MLVIAGAFVFESAWVFLAASVLFLAWCGYILMAPDES